MPRGYRFEAMWNGMALDRSTRNIDRDGNLHVGSSIVTQACISPYIGGEIPDYQRLGLDPSRVYYLLRDPDALRRAVPSLHGKPLLTQHEPQTASTRDPVLTVGTVINPKWDPSAFAVTAELSVWDATAIAGIERGSKKGLSAGYRYTPLMQRGTWRGQSYDGLMVDIDFNHVALVPEPRVATAMVGDSLPREIQKQRISKGTNMSETLQQVADLLKEKFSPEDLKTLADMICNTPDDGSLGAMDSRGSRPKFPNANRLSLGTPGSAR